MSFTRRYNFGTSVTLTAPSADFYRWTKDGVHYEYTPEVTVVADVSHTFKAWYPTEVISFVTSAIEEGYTHPSPLGVISVIINVAGTGYDIGDVLTIVGGDNNATIRITYISGPITSVSIAYGGTSGYQVGDILTLTGGTGDGKVKVETVDGSGVITSISINDPGTTYDAPNGYNETTGGSGSADAIIFVDNVGSPKTVVGIDVKYSGSNYILGIYDTTYGGTGIGTKVEVTYIYPTNAFFTTVAQMILGSFSSETPTVWDSWVHFNNINVPQGATIVYAYLVITGYTTSGTTCRAVIHFQDTDNAVAPTNATQYYTITANLTSGVSWNSVPEFVNNIQYQSPNLATALQTVISRLGWVQNNSLNVLLRDDGSSYGVKRYIQPYFDGAAELHIGYIV